MRTYLVVISICLTFSLGAQNYKTSIGLEYDDGYGLALKKLFDAENGIEFSWTVDKSSSRDRTRMSLAYLRHCHFFKSWGERLRWYYGAGLNLINYSYDDPNYNDRVQRNTNWALSGFLGSEYSFRHIPISISADWSPVYFFESNVDRIAWDYGSVSIKYSIN